jgi:zinc protease
MPIPMLGLGRPTRSALGLLVALALLGPQHAAPVEAQSSIPFSSYTLENGLHVILSPDPQATAVAVNLWYRVGSRNERPGRSGFGHLFEHLMFQGSENVREGEHFQFVERAGGNLNASITEDRTNYFQTLPPDRMNLALWLEADRMRSLRITEENMKREVEVVKEERSLRIDNAPYGTSQLDAGFYAAYNPETCFAYAHSVIGSPEDLDAAELLDVQQFFDLYYAPNNATLTVVGAFDEAEARALIEEYFGSIPRGNEPPEIRCDTPFSHLPVTRRIQDGNAQLPAVWISYGTVERSHPDAPALDVLASILGGGESSRLNQRVVRTEQAALQTAAFHNARLGPGLLQVVGIANMGVDSDRLLTLLDEEVTRIVEEGVTEAEVTRARNQARASLILGRQSVMGRAEALQTANHFYGSPDAVDRAVEALATVSAADVLRVARAYLDPNRRATIFTVPGTGQEEDR